MRLFVNGFLVLFLLDAVISVASEQMGIAGGMAVFPTLRQVVARLVLIASIPLYGAMALRPDIPKHLFVPMLAAYFWLLLGSMPIPVYVGLGNVGPYASAIQLVVAALALLRVRMLTGGSWLFDRQSLPEGSSGGVAGGATFLAISGLLAPVLLGLYVFFSLGLALESATSGFLHMTRDGVVSEARE